MADPKDWWIRRDSDWQPIGTMPRRSGPFVLANADKTKTWLSDGARKTRSGTHELFIEEGHPESAKKLVGAGDEHALWAQP